MTQCPLARASLCVASSIVCTQSFDCVSIRAQCGNCTSKHVTMFYPPLISMLDMPHHAIHPTNQMCDLLFVLKSGAQQDRSGQWSCWQASDSLALHYCVGFFICQKWCS